MKIHIWRWVTRKKKNWLARVLNVKRNNIVWHCLLQLLMWVYAIYWEGYCNSRQLSAPWDSPAMTALNHRQGHNSIFPCWISNIFEFIRGTTGFRNLVCSTCKRWPQQPTLCLADPLWNFIVAVTSAVCHVNGCYSYVTNILNRDVLKVCHDKFTWTKLARIIVFISIFIMLVHVKPPLSVGSKRAFWGIVVLWPSTADGSFLQCRGTMQDRGWKEHRKEQDEFGGHHCCQLVWWTDMRDLYRSCGQLILLPY